MDVANQKEIDCDLNFPSTRNSRWFLISTLTTCFVTSISFTHLEMDQLAFPIKG